ncbi:Aminopeptidase 2 [Fusarium oxysporum f. sp. conglutinans]|nr:Aminopeptidase 2 [Fusarium oxysporum f. sp. conglutinans]
MVVNNLGDTKFFEGVKLYHRGHQFQCTESDDFCKAWEEVTGESIAASMRVSTKEHGFLVLRVAESRDASGKVISVRLFQQRFLTSGVAKQEDVVSDTIYPLRFTIRHTMSRPLI